MTTPEVRQPGVYRAATIRVIASSLCFDQTPPVVRSLAGARKAAEGIVDALVDGGILPAEYGNGNGAPTRKDEGPDSEPLFPPNGLGDAEA